MLGPPMNSRVEQWHDLATFRVHGGEVRSLAPIAVEAGQSQVGQFSMAAVLLGDDMVRFVWPHHGTVGDEAVLAAGIGAALQGHAQVRGDSWAADAGRLCCQALALMSVTSWSSRAISSNSASSEGVSAPVWFRWSNS